MKLLKFAKFSLFCVLIFLLCIVGIYGYAWLNPRVTLTNVSNISFFDKEGRVFGEMHGGNNWVSLDGVSPYLKEATIAVEDRNFYRHFGFDYPRIVMAAIINIRSNAKSQGASTITQQLARNQFLTLDKTWQRKIREAFLAVQLEVHYSKDEILEGYVNNINYGHGIYGISNASRFYFDKYPIDLTLAEASLLAGIPKTPTRYSPVTHFDQAKARQRTVLNAMVENGKITKEQKYQAFNEELNIIGDRNTGGLKTVMYYQDAALKEIIDRRLVPEELMKNGGLRVYTNLDMEAQRILEEAVRIEARDSHEELEVASVMIDPRTGAVIALVGGKDYSVTQFNRVTQSSRQVGSTIKPLLYYAALENGFTAATTFKSEPTTFLLSYNKSYSPQNFNQTYPNKQISMAAALAFSDNIYAVKTHMFLGNEVLVETAQRFGIRQELSPLPSLALGTGEINMLDFATAYATLANNGYKNDIHLVQKVKDRNGQILFEHEPEPQLVLDQNYTFILNSLMANCDSRELVDYTHPTCYTLGPRLTRRYAMKTGSTDTDSWMVGYNPNNLIITWMGYDDNRELSREDSRFARYIWARAMETFLADEPEVWYEQPERINAILVNPITGQHPVENDRKKILYFVKGSEPRHNANRRQLDAMIKTE